MKFIFSLLTLLFLIPALAYAEHTELSLYPAPLKSNVIFVLDGPTKNENTVLTTEKIKRVKNYLTAFISNPAISKNTNIAFMGADSATLGGDSDGFIWLPLTDVSGDNHQSILELLSSYGVGTESASIETIEETYHMLQGKAEYLSGLNNCAKNYIVVLTDKDLTQNYLMTHEGENNTHLIVVNTRIALEQQLLMLEQALTHNTDAMPYISATIIPINPFYRLEPPDQIYYSLFQPKTHTYWAANFKRYNLKNGQVLDSNNNPVFSTQSSLFRSSAKSVWTLGNADGNEVPEGGMASRLTQRRVFSNLKTNTLTQPQNRIQPDNINNIKPFLPSDLAASADENIAPIIQWLAGYQTEDASRTRLSLEDALHSTAIIVNYGELNIGGRKTPDATAFVGTNAGYLHAFSLNEYLPKEHWAFIPKDLIATATAYPQQTSTKQYGLDGPMTLWHEDLNQDFIVNEGEKAYLYIAMRRGGSSYYALDISNREKPKLIWQIKKTASNFIELGQTWSKMQLADVLWQGQKRKVLFFGGGYDEAEDDAPSEFIGNAIYMVDALTGKLLWKASNQRKASLVLPDMTRAIVGDIALIDNQGRGIVDLLYAADVGGRIWRIDLNPDASTAKTYAKGGILASLNARFFNALDVVYSDAFPYVKMTPSGQPSILKKPRYMLSIGSGDHAHPLAKNEQDYFYTLFDYNVTKAPDSYLAIQQNQLEVYSTDDALIPSEKSNNGWAIKIKNQLEGEKILSSSITINNVIYFTTIRPISGSSCTQTVNKNSLYELNLNTTRNRESSRSRNASKAINIYELKDSGLPNINTVFSFDNAEPALNLLIGSEVIPVGHLPYPLQKTFWRQLD